MDDDELAKLKAAGHLGHTVYMFHNPETEAFYIGSSIDTYSRLSAHVGQLKRGVHPNYKFQKAYASNPNFQFVPVPIETVDRNVTLRIEDALIKESWGDPNLLNLAMDTQRPRLGDSPTQETRDKISRSRKKLFEDGYINPMQGKHHSSEVLVKMCENTRRMFESEPERKDEVSRRTTAMFQDPEYRERHSAAVKQAMENEEVKARLSQGGKTFWENPQLRAQATAAAIERNNRPEVKQAFVERTARIWADPEYRAKQCKQVSIEGVVYESMSEAARSLGVGIATVNYRLNSTSERFKDWLVV